LGANARHNLHFFVKGQSMPTLNRFRPLLGLLTLLATLGLLTAWATLPRDAQVATVHKLYEAFDTGRLALLDEAVAENYVDHMPLPGVPSGREGLKRTVEIFRAGLPDMKSTIEQVIVENEFVVTRLTITGTHRGDFLGVKGTGKKITFAGLDIHRVQGGRVVESWHVEDLLGALQQIATNPAAK
jgi:predicted ester cyclase